MSDQDELAKELQNAFDEDKSTTEEVPEKTTEIAKSSTDQKPEGKRTEEAPKKEEIDGGAEQPTPESGEKPTDEGAESAKTPEEKKEEADSKDDKPKDEPETPAAPLTKDDVKSVISDFRNEERSLDKALNEATDTVLDAYFPEGLNDKLIDENTGKELRTPQDVVDATDGKMGMDQASQWLENEKYKLKQDIKNIKENAEKIAESDMSFRKDALTALKKYDPLFQSEGGSKIQEKVWNSFQKQIVMDKTGKFVAKAPDILEYYDDYLEPHRLKFEQDQQKAATANVNPEPEKAPEPPKPTKEDRMDINGDGGASEPLADDDFAGHLKRELANPN